MKIVIDISDWEEEVDDSVKIQERDDIIEMLSLGLSTGLVARATIVSREKGVADENIIGSNKALLNLGAQLEISKVARSATEEVMASDGKVYHLRSLVGRVQNLSQESRDEESYIPVYDDRAMERAIDYLLHVVPGHIRSRLEIIYAKGGDIDSITAQLKDEINKQVYDLKHRRTLEK